MLCDLGDDSVVGENRSDGNRWSDSVFLVPLIALGVVARTIHLFGDHYHLLGTDSYYFASQAGDVPDTALRGSGLTYPVGLLPFADYWLPIMIGIGLILICYWIGVRISNRLTGLSAAFVAAILPQAVYISAAGNIDRDGYCVVLVAIAIMTWWEFRHRWHWLPVVLLLTGIMALSWAWVSGLIIPAVILLLWLVMWKRESLPVLPVAVYTVSAVVAGVIGAAASGQIKTIATYLLNPDGIAELASTDLFALVHHYGFLLLPLAYGVVVAVDRRDRPGGILLLCWGAIFWAAGFWAQRAMVFAVPAVAVLAGYGLAVVLGGLRGLDQPEMRKRLGIVMYIVILAVTTMSIYQASQIGSYWGVAASNDWVGALRYLEAETPQNSRILAHWDYCKWVAYLADREPVGGVHPMYMESDIEYLYEHPGYLPKLMDRTDADYFITERDSLATWEAPPWHANGSVLIYRR